MGPPLYAKLSDGPRINASVKRGSCKYPLEKRSKNLFYKVMKPNNFEIEANSDSTWLLNSSRS